MEFQWIAYRIPMGYLGNARGIPRITYGMPMEFRWNYSGIDMTSTWNTYGIPLEYE